MLSVSSPNMSKEYALKVVAFVNKVFSTYRENLEERSCKNLALSVVELSDYTYPELYAWLEFLLLGLYKGDKGCTRYRHLYMQTHSVLFTVSPLLMEGSVLGYIFLFFEFETN